MIHRRIGTAVPVALLLLAGMMLSAGGPRLRAAAPQSAARPAAPQARSPLARGPVPDLNIVFTAQVIGWIEPCG
jgi:hypothetical protein